jgi:hypothetical protein
MTLEGLASLDFSFSRDLKSFRGSPSRLDFGHSLFPFDNRKSFRLSDLAFPNMASSRNAFERNEELGAHLGARSMAMLLPSILGAPSTLATSST